MFRSKLDLFKKEWLEVVFENRNREYGAYELRKLSTKATNTALLIVLAVAFILSAPKAFNLDIFPEKEVEEAPVITEVTLEDLDIPDVEEEEEEEEEEILQAEEQQRIAQDVPAEDLVRFPEPEVVPESEVKEEVASQDDFKDEKKTPARISLKGAAGGTGVPVGEFGPKKVEGQITGSETGDPEGQGIYDFNAVEIAPEPKGGIEAFRKWIGNNYQYPQGAIDAGVKGTVQVSFVVDTDGSLTDIKVIRDLSYGTGQAAINLLKKAAKWNPGIQNGRPVRVQYSLPITLNLQDF